MKVEFNFLWTTFLVHLQVCCVRSHQRDEAINDIVLQVKEDLQESRKHVVNLEVQLAEKEALLVSVRHEQEVNQANIHELQEQIKANQAEVESLRKVEIELLQVQTQLKNAQTQVS